MGTSPTTADVVQLIAAWGGGLDPGVLHGLRQLDVDTLMRAVTTTVTELLGTVAERAAADDAGASMLVERAVALARSGQMTTAAAVAGPLIERAGLSPSVRAALLQTTVLTLSSAAAVADIDVVVEAIDRSLYPPTALRRLASTHQFAHVLCGDRAARVEALAADVQPEVTAATGTLPLVMRSIGLMIAADGEQAVEVAERAADGYRELATRSAHELASVDVWPARFRYFTYGRDDARHHLAAWQQRTATSGQAWVDPAHRTNSATIALAFGEIDDAAAGCDAAVEIAEQTGYGWVSWAVGIRARIDVLRGDLDAAQQRVEAFQASHRPDSLGLHVIGLAAVEVAAGRGRPIDHRAVWSLARQEDNRLWQLLCGLDLARIGRRLDADVQPLLRELAELDSTPALRHVPEFARASLHGDAEAAAAAAERCRRTFSVVDAARLAADAAVLAARDDRALARRLGTMAVEQLTALGAGSESRNVRSELRDHGVSLGVRGTRRRPTTGWEALTATESKIVAMVAEGMTGPEIGRQLYISPRTVQTHVSSALKKLGLANRLELVTAYTSRTAPSGWSHRTRDGGRGGAS